MTATASLLLEPAALKPGAALRILPAGVFRSIDGRPGNIAASKAAYWRIDAAIASRVIEAFGAGNAALVIDYEHQTLNAASNGQPAPAAGWFKGLEWREGQGLFMTNLEWTERARAMIAAREYRYLSPVFNYDKDTGEVMHLRNVALTNDPGLVGLSDLAANRAETQQGGVPCDGLGKKDRATLMNAFGDLPGWSIDAHIREGVTEQRSAGAGEGMSAKDRATFQYFFGFDPVE